MPSSQVLLLRWGEEVPRDQDSALHGVMPLDNRSSPSSTYKDSSTHGASPRKRIRRPSNVTLQLEREYYESKQPDADSRTSDTSTTKKAPSGVSYLFSGGKLLAAFEVMRYAGGKLRLVGYNKVSQI